MFNFSKQILNYEFLNQLKVGDTDVCQVKYDFEDGFVFTGSIGFKGHFIERIEGSYNQFAVKEGKFEIISSYNGTFQKNKNTDIIEFKDGVLEEKTKDDSLKRISFKNGEIDILGTLGFYNSQVLNIMNRNQNAQNI